MARIFVVADDDAARVEVWKDDDGFGRARCWQCLWQTDPDRYDTVEDVIDEAGVHVDRAHGGIS